MHTNTLAGKLGGVETFGEQPGIESEENGGPATATYFRWEGRDLHVAGFAGAFGDFLADYGRCDWTTCGPESMLMYRMTVRVRHLPRAGERDHVFGTFPPCAVLLVLHR